MRYGNMYMNSGKNLIGKSSCVPIKKDPTSHFQGKNISDMPLRKLRNKVKLVASNLKKDKYDYEDTRNYSNYSRHNICT